MRGARRRALGVLGAVGGPDCADVVEVVARDSVDGLWEAAVKAALP